jgi:hypothetical protein
MSLTKEAAHDLRLITSQPSDLAVLPPWAKIIPVAFWASLIALCGFASYHKINTRICEERTNAQRKVFNEYQEMLNQDKNTIRHLKEQNNMAIRFARWVDYSPMLQGILIGTFSAVDNGVQISDMRIERKQGAQPDYSVDISFRAHDGNNISMVTRKMKENLKTAGWVLTTIAQTFQDGTINYHGDIQGSPATMTLESQYLLIQDDVKEGGAQ